MKIVRYVDNGQFYGIHINLFGGWLFAVERRRFPGRGEGKPTA